MRISFYARVWYLKVRAGNSPVGYANCGVEEDAIHIDDIRIENEARQRESFGLLRTVLNWQKKPINYRRRGLGNALLRLVERVAGERGFRRLTGDLSPHDLLESPQLPDWYRRRGFVVHPGGRHGTSKVEKILNA